MRPINTSKKPAILLSNTTLKVYEIAGLTGYRSEKHFSSSFKAMTGLTPSEFRNTATAP